ncbi:MAG: hypothetical protein J6J31_02780 [Thermoguttaceae bacterium]|nr:hypothetical protein [Thermoguttaceae bacterium]
MVRFGKNLSIWGTLGVSLGLAGMVHFASGQHFSADSYRNTQPVQAEEMTVGEMLADQPLTQKFTGSAQTPVHVIGNYAPEIAGDDGMPMDWAAVSANVGKNTASPISRASVSDPAAGQDPSAAVGTIRQMSYEAPRNVSRHTVQTPESSQTSAVSETPIRLTSHQTAASAQQVLENPVSEKAVSGKAVSAEPAELPADYPAGEMAPLDQQNLIAFSETLNLSSGPIQQITLIDPIQKVLCVYHISMTTGQIELKSARKVEWDLQLIFLNSRKPLPQDVQAIIEQNHRRR